MFVGSILRMVSERAPSGMNMTLFIFYLGKPSNNEDESHPDWLPSIDVGGQTSNKTSDGDIRRQKREMVKLLLLTNLYCFIVHQLISISN